MQFLRCNYDLLPSQRFSVPEGAVVGAYLPDNNLPAVGREYSSGGTVCVSAPSPNATVIDNCTILAGFSLFGTVTILRKPLLILLKGVDC